MKKITYLLAFSVFLLVSCGTSSSKSENESSSKEVEINDDTKSVAKNCDEFLDQYEEWNNESIKLLEAMIKNPMDMELTNKYMMLGSEAMEWTSNWSNFYDCAAKEKYQKRFDEIAEKTEQKLKELGLD